MLSGALDEFPKLDVYFPHAGGFFAFVNPRIAFARGNMGGAGGGGGESMVAAEAAGRARTCDASTTT